ncbi:MAG TPA: O-methyltransferase [Acidobacteriaceae bacterium]|nr:O-methyltransferase [Acidobacteriaceae bacterium]
MSKAKEEMWGEVDGYITATIPHNDSALKAAIEANHAAGLPAIDVSAPQGKLLHLLALITGARRVLEIGTLGGYSTIWLARALAADGTVVTLEFSPKHAEVARKNLDAAGVGSKVEIRVGAAADSLEQLVRDGQGPFDLIFIDADKKNNPVYVQWALKLARRGTVIVVDNVIRDGKVVEENSGNADIEGTRAMFELVGREPRVTATAIQTVGGKGYDGFVIAVVTGD